MPVWEPAFLTAIAARTAIVFVMLVVGVRITGRRQTGELNVHDLLLVLMLANAVQNAMTKGDGRLSVALVSSGVLLLLGTLFAMLQSRHASVERFVVGTPTVLAENGRLHRRNVGREAIGEQEIMAAVRDQGLADISAVRFAVLEVDGSISVIPRDQKLED